VVYRAEQVRTRRTVAIKMLLPRHGTSPRQQERFEREARMAAALHHPNIVTVYESGAIADGRFGLAMEFIDGMTLDRWSRSLEPDRGRGGMRRAQRQRLAVMVKVCDAVLCAHQHAIVHRDLKPANILIDGAGEPHVLDFGVAHQTGTDDRARLTHTGEFAGTLAYASPEQVAGDPARVDTRTDIYSLGVILYELLSGRLPYEVGGPLALAVRNIEKTEPAPLPAHGPGAVEADVATIVLKAMEKDPARRYATAAGLRNDLERALAGEPISARRDQTWYVLLKGLRKHRRALGAAAGLLVAVLAGLAGLGYGLIASHESRVRETIERDRAADAARRAQAVAIVLQEVLPARGGGTVESGLENITAALDTGWLTDRPALASDVEEVLTEIYRARQTRSGWEAEMAARSARMLNSALYGPDAPRTLASAHNEAQAVYARGRLADAERLARGTLERRIAALGDHGAGVLASRGLLARILLALDRTDEAAAECRAALNPAGLAGAAALETAGVRRTYGAVLLRRGEPAAAGEQCILALRAHCLEYRDTNADIAADLGLLAGVFEAGPVGERWPSSELAGIAGAWPEPAGVLRRLAAALDGEPDERDRPALARALPDLLVLKSLVLADQPAELAETHALLGRALNIYGAGGDAPREQRLAAAAQFMEAARILEATIGPGTLAVANCYDAVAEETWDCDPALAVDATRRSLAAWRALPAEQRDQQQLATQERGAADIMTIGGAYAEAEEHYRIALEQFELLLGDRSYVVATTNTRYAEMLRRAGRLEEAERRARQGYEVGNASASAPPDQRIMYAMVLGTVLTDRWRPREAEPLLYEAIAFVFLNGDSARHGQFERVCQAMTRLRLERGDLYGARWWRGLARSGLSYRALD
jgi:serine/threonine-protein kinase